MPLEGIQEYPVTAMVIGRLVLFAVLIITCAYTDMTRGRVYNSVTLSAIPLALLMRLVDPIYGGWAYMMHGVVAATMAFIVLFIIWVIGALSGKPLMGGGDVKLMTAIGALMGVRFTGWVLVYAVIVGAVMAIWVLLKHGEVWAGMVGSFRRLIWPSHPAEVSDVEKRATSRTISFCTAICIGGLITLVAKPDLVFF